MRIAVVGSGIAGMGSAWLLSRAYEVHLFEQEHRLGGHTHTVVHSVSGRPIALDTGFLVYNEHTYPLLTRLFGELDVATRASDMSFSVSCRQPDLVERQRAASRPYRDCKSRWRSQTAQMVRCIR